MVRLLTNSDRQLILDYIGRNEIDALFLYSNVIEFGIDNRKDKRRCAHYYGFFEGENLKGILPFYNLGSCIPHFESDTAVPYFSEIMQERKFEFLIGMQKLVKPLYDMIKGYKQIVSYDESSYFVNKAHKPFLVEGIRFIDAAASQNKEIIDFIISARANGFNQTASAEDIKEMLSQKGKEEDFLIAEMDGKPVAQACVNAYTPEINQIGGVYTAEEERSKGYCKAVVSELCGRITARGKLPALSVKKKNVPAVRAYTALGFELYDDYLIIRFG